MISRRHFLQSMFAALAAGALYSWRVEPYWVEDVSVTLALPHLPADLVGKKLIQLSDLHIGDTFDWHSYKQQFERIRELSADWVVYTGDFISYTARAEQFDELAGMLQFAPLGRIGTAAVLGNHDYGHGWRDAQVGAAVAERLQSAGITLLRNRVESFGGLQIGGIDDSWGPYFDPRTALAMVEKNRPIVMLSHNPDTADLPVWQNYQGWILSGHTHGGQCRPPFLPPLVLPVNNKRYTAGRFDLDGRRTLYINRGLGNVFPVRFNVRPEITIFTLAQA